MILKDKKVTLQGRDGLIDIERNSYGIPEIKAQTHRDASLALGWVHVNDRQMQMMLTRVILEGRAAEKLSGDKALVEADKYIRSLDLFPDMEEQIKHLEPEVAECAAAYADGVNLYLGTAGTVLEFKLLGYRPEPWRLQDTMMLAKSFSYFGLTDVQGNMEKLILQMIQNGIDERRIKELFPYITEDIDVELLKKVKLAPPLVPEAVKWLSYIPRFTGSNNWVISSEHSKSGKPILCGDPHLEVNRLPSIWHEVIIRLPSNTFKGFALPGTPSIVVGRNDYIAFSPTYAFMDMIDFRIEECKGGMYRRGNRWIPFELREETIKIKGKNSEKIVFYHNEHGILEGNPYEDGYYLVRSWSAQKGCGAWELNVIHNVMKSKSVREAMKHYRNLDAASFNFLIADRSGNIGYQMTGRLFARPKGVSGLIPLPGWERKYDSRGFVPKTSLPNLYNPKEGIIVTANQDLNYLGKATPINLAMAPYRAERILQLLKRKKKIDVDYMKEIHYDLYSIQAEKLMRIIIPLLPNENKNAQILKEWDFVYRADSIAPTVFENIYRAILLKVFGDYGLGREVVNYLLDETSMFNDYFGNFDNIIFNKKSSWFKNGTREDVLKMAVDEGLKAKAVPYGRTRKIYFKNLLFGDKVPSFFGLDFGPVELPGNRATVTQGQIFRSGGRLTTFSPSCRIIADMSDTRLLTNTTGGNCDRPFTRWYKNNMEGWLKGEYKLLI